MFSSQTSKYSYISAPPQYSPRAHSSAHATTHTERGPYDEDDTITEGLCPDALQVFDVDGDVDGTVPVQLRNFCTRGSYSWVEAPRPTILVPGSPRAWRDRAVPFQVAKDSGASVFDPSGYFMAPMSKLLPLFRAVDAIEEAEPVKMRTNWGALDFVLDRSSMRKLLRWVRCVDPETPRSRAFPLPPPFRLDLQLGGQKTVLVDRWDTRTYETTRVGFRGNFDEATTAPTTSGRATKYHHRIVQYDLESLRLMVRFEIDAYVPDDDDPADLFANLNLSPLPIPPVPGPATADSDMAIEVVRDGKLIPHSSLIEITTRSYKAQHKWHETYSQIFLSQTPHFYLGVHDRGTFFEIEKHELASPTLSQYEDDECMQRALRQLVRFLETVQELVKQHGKQGRLSLVCREGKLELFERTADDDGAGRMPESVLARFERSTSRP